MVGEATASQKKRAFDELYALDESGEDDQLDEGLLSSVNALKGKTLGDPTVVTPSDRLRTTTLARSLSTPHPQKNIGIGRSEQSAARSIHSDDIVKDTPFPSLQKRRTLTGLQSTEQPATASSQVPSSTAPPSSAIPRAAGKRKRDADIKLVPEQLRIFRNLHFYFFINDDIHPGRRNRIIKAIEYGATWQRDWNSSVTHIILDSNLRYDHIKMKVKHIPDHVIVVDEGYPADCIKYRLLLDPSQKHYQVKGYVPLNGKTIAEPPHSVPNKPSQKSDKSLELKPPGKGVMARPVQTQTTTRTETTPSATTNSDKSTRPVDGQTEPDTDGDELDLAIREAKDIERDSEPVSSSSDPGDTSHIPEEEGSTAPAWQQKFQCMHKHTGKTKSNPNAYTISILLELADYYAQIRDEWRPKAYRSAIAALRRCPTKINTRRDALRLNGIGESIADKIEEIVVTNRLRKLEYAKLDPRERILQDFLKIYGVGHDQATKWYAAGYRSLDELSQKASLTPNQKIGLAHYTDFNTRIPRAEVEQHAQVVRNCLKALDASYTVHTMGSYRRGAELSGDIDLIITAGSTTTLPAIRTLVFEQLVPRLTSSGFLVAALAATSAADGSKWHGASVLPSPAPPPSGTPSLLPTSSTSASSSARSSGTWRRIDLLLVPASELGAALIYFTGNDIFNRSLRLLASKKGMRLNQRGLYKDVLRDSGREKMSEGTLVEGRDERKIFEALGVPWRPPEHRIC
ncbi:hypothetical protein MBLNU459_g6950t1 [Dothideomycetes sp. NU459]